MEVFVSFCSFLGAWLLVAGPIYQAALELRDEDIETDHLQEITKQVSKPPKVSTWWWLVPPVKIWLERKRNNQYRKQFLSALSDEDTKIMVSFINKATGWLFVASGGLLIAIKETYELSRLLHWSIVIFLVAVVILAILSVANTAYRIARSERIISVKKP